MSGLKSIVPGMALPARGSMAPKAGLPAIVGHSHELIKPGAKPFRKIVTSFIDDSGSIQAYGNAPAIRRGHNAAIEHYRTPEAQPDHVLIGTRYLNGRTLFPPIHPAQAVLMNERNYCPNQGTPLFREGARALMAHEAAVATMADNFSAIGCFIFMTDGANNEDGTAADVKRVVDRLLATGTHLIYGLGVEDGSTDFRAVFRSMGILDDFINVLPREEGDIVEGMTQVSRMTSSVVDAESFTRESVTGFSRAPRAPAAPKAPEAPTRRAGTDDLAGMLAPAAATPAAPVAGQVAEWGPVDTSPEAALQFVPELGVHVLQFPKGVDKMIVGRQEPSRALRDAGVFFVEVTDPAGLVSRRHIKIECTNIVDRLFLGFGRQPNYYRITILDKLDPNQDLFVAVNGKFIEGSSKIVSAGSEISLSPAVKFRLGLKGGI